MTLIHDLRWVYWTAGAQGGEFAFVVFTLANQLNVLPEELNRLLIVVVILSMVLTPALASAGDKLGNALEEWEAGKAMAAGEEAGGALVQVPVDDGEPPPSRARSPPPPSPDPPGRARVPTLC